MAHGGLQTGHHDVNRSQTDKRSIPQEAVWSGMVIVIVIVTMGTVGMMITISAVIMTGSTPGAVMTGRSPGAVVTESTP